MPSNDQDLAHLYAEYLAQQTTPMYDDGVSLLRRDPAMLDVGLFGKGPKPKPVAPPVNVQRRRLLGLSDEAPKQELPMQTPGPANLPAPVQAPMPSQAPLSSMAYKSLTTPMSRRQFLGNTARTAGQMALRGVVPELAKLAETSQKFPLQEMAPQAPQPSYITTLRNSLSDYADYVASEHDEGKVLGLHNIYKALRKFEPDILNAMPDFATRAKEATKLTRKYNKDPDDFDLESDAEDAWASLITDIANHLPDDKVYNALELIDEDIGNYDDISHVIEQLHDAGHAPNEIHDFLDTHRPDYDSEVADAILQSLQKD